MRASIPRVNAYDDVIHETIHPALAAAALVEKALTWQVSRLDGQNDFMLQRLAETRSELARLKIAHPIWKGRKVARGIVIGRS